MREQFLPFNQPEIDEQEIDAVAAAMRSRWITRGALVDQFEGELSDYLDGAPVVAVSSCTAALHLALLAHDIGPGDEVITTPYTFAASVNVIVHVGATPVLVDIDPNTGNIDPERVEAALTPRTKAVIPVHFAGHPVDLPRLNAMRDRHGIVLIEDAAHALAADRDGRKVGTWGNLTAFSFYATKNLTTGEGGALVVPDADRIDKVRRLSLHGLSRHAWNRYTAAGSWQYEVLDPGFKYNMTDIEAAMGRVQLRKLAAMQGRRRELAARLSRGLEGLPVIVPEAEPGVGHAWHLYPLGLRLEAIEGDRADVVEDLRRANIGTSVHFIPIHLHPYYQRRFGWRRGDFPIAERYFDREISLPLYPGMTDRDADDVAAAVRASLERRRRG